MFCWVSRKSMMFSMSVSQRANRHMSWNDKHTLNLMYWEKHIFKKYTNLEMFQVKLYWHGVILNTELWWFPTDQRSFKIEIAHTRFLRKSQERPTTLFSRSQRNNLLEIRTIVCVCSFFIKFLTIPTQRSAFSPIMSQCIISNWYYTTNCFKLRWTREIDNNVKMIIAVGFSFPS